jgi:hypothetical protein
VTYPYLKNFATKSNSIYYIKSGIVAALLYSKKKPFLCHIYTTGDFVGIDKYQDDVGIIDYYMLTECDYEIVSDDQLNSEKYKESFREFMKTFLQEITAYRTEDYDKILEYNLEKISRFSNEIEGIPLSFVKEMGIKNDLDKLLEKDKVVLENQVYKIIK